MNQKLTFLVAVAMLGTSGAAYAQEQATGTANGTTRILQAISIDDDSNLQFGSIVRPSSGTNTVTVSTSGARSLGGGGNAALAGGGSVSAAAFTVKGEGGQSFSITPDETFVMDGPGQSDITVTTNPSATSDTLSGSIGAEGMKSFTVGGSFEVSSATASGEYSGQLNVIVAYN